MAPGEGPVWTGRGPPPRKFQRHVCFHSNELVASLLARRVLQLSVLLIICRSRVRAPPAPPAFYTFTDRFVTGSWTGGISASGLWRAKVYAGKHPLSGRALVTGVALASAGKDLLMTASYLVAGRTPASRCPRAPSRGIHNILSEVRRSPDSSSRRRPADRRRER